MGDKSFEYINNYQRLNYDRITILRSKGDKEKLKAVAAIKNMSVSEFINSCIDKELKRMKINFENSNN